MKELPAALTRALRDRYEFVRELGRGGMAVVYLAKDLKHTRPVAVKVLRSDLSATLGTDRFLKEIEIAARLTHPHILALHDSGERDGILYYVMPFVDGESLRDVLVREGRLPLDRALDIANEVAGALTYAHRNGVVHRDIKPENILFSDGHAVVADFGIAKAVSTAGDSQLTKTGFPIGTPGYMSPEQALGNTAQLDARTDVYSLACVFYEMVIGTPPGMWISHEAAQLRRFVDASPEHRERLDLISGSVEQAMVHAMAMQPDDRFATANEFAAAIDGRSRKQRRYSEAEAADIVRHAAEIQESQPTNPPVSLAGIQQVAAQVGIPPEHVQQAAVALDQPDDRPIPGGLFGVRGNLVLEGAIEGEILPEDYEVLLEEIRARVGEVGRINETLGRSLSWNSLSFQNSVEGGGRLLHVMISPKQGRTTIRITESAGQLGVVLASLGAAAGFASAVAITGALDGGAAILAAGASVGASYYVVRVLFRRFISRRFRKLRELKDSLTQHVTGAIRRTG